MKTNTLFTSILLTLAVVFTTQSIIAQSNRQVSKIGLYLLDPIKGSLPPQVQFTMPIPPVTLESERSIFPHVSIGTELGGMKMDMRINGLPSTRSESEDFKQSVIFLWGIVKGVASFNLTERIEAYGSLGIGYGKAFVTSNNDDYNSAVSSLGMSQLSAKTKTAAIGANVYLSDNFGFFGEVGLKDTKGIFKVGVVFKKI